MLRNDIKALTTGDIFISELTLISDAGPVVDMTNMFVELNIFENLFENFTSGNIFILDAVNMIGKLPIIGNERLRIRFLSTGREEFYENEFQIYSTETRLLTKESEQFYSLSFTSILNYTNKMSSVNLGYSKPNSDIVEDIFTKSFPNIKTEIAASKSLFVQKTKDNLKCVIPGWRPLDAINWIVQRSFTNDGQNKTSVPDFIFFQNKYGYHFKSLSAMTMGEPVIKYVRSYANVRGETGTVDLNRANRIVSNLTFESSNNKNKALELGLNSSTMITVDPLRHDWQKRSFSYQEYFTKSKHLYPNSLERKLPDNQGIIPSLTAGTADYIVPENSAAYENSQGNDSLNRCFLQRKSVLESWDYTKIQITTPGDSNRTVGDLVYLNFPSAQQQSEGEEEDPMSSGRYLITALRHKISKKNYQLISTLSRDCYKNPIPDATTFD